MHYRWKRIVKESIGPLIMAAVFSIISGISLNSGLGLKKLTSILIIIPAFINISGDLGAVVASRISTDMYMGKNRILLNFIGAMVVGIVLYSFLGLISWLFIFLSSGSGQLLQYLKISLIAGISSLLIVAGVTIGLEKLGKRLNMDPSDLSIPFLSSTGDAVGVSLLIFTAKTIMGV